MRKGTKLRRFLSSIEMQIRKTSNECLQAFSHRESGEVHTRANSRTDVKRYVIGGRLSVQIDRMRASVMFGISICGCVQKAKRVVLLDRHTG